MDTFDFSALGTKWSILTFGKTFSDADKKAILDMMETFENRFSRFRDTSEVNAFRNIDPGVYEISEMLFQMLERAEELRKLTNGRFDPGLGLLLEEAGYDPQYRLEPGETERITLSHWNLEGEKLFIDGPIVFDLGGIGKGFCIDEVATLLRTLGFQYFLIDAGGDMYGTEKEDGSPFRIALEWPGKPDTAFGTVELRHQGLAVSDTFRRRWGKWHHILNPKEKNPVEEVIGVSAVAKNAFDADCMTSVLFQLSREEIPHVTGILDGQYVVFHSDSTVDVSAHWPGELF
ncbi:MAG: FAD:protein FMN transferase [Patescibacteria group bacterium]